MPVNPNLTLDDLSVATIKGLTIDVLDVARRTSTTY